MTGDSLYPGRLGGQLAQVPTFAASAQRLAVFVSTHEVAHVLGTHIEQTKTPFLDYPRGTNYQPDEHSLDLTRAHVIELNDAFIKMGDSPEQSRCRNSRFQSAYPIPIQRPRKPSHRLRSPSEHFFLLRRPTHPFRTRERQETTIIYEPNRDRNSWSARRAPLRACERTVAALSDPWITTHG